MQFFYQKDLIMFIFCLFAMFLFVSPLSANVLGEWIELSATTYAADKKTENEGYDGFASCRGSAQLWTGYFTISRSQVRSMNNHSNKIQMSSENQKTKPSN
jgi:hypothetical protein